MQGNLSQNKRQEALNGFRDGRYQILVATDIAARGIDVSCISHVINFDIPDTTDAYTHRIGRTGRAAKTGDAFTFITREDEPLVRSIERVLGEKIETLEETLLQEPRKSVIDEIYTYKREMNFLRKNISPAKEMILALSKVESELLNESTNIHFKELLNNIHQAIDSSETYREILSDQLNIYHTTISSKLNDVMKFLTIFSVIFIPLTFIAGIYGTNFDVLPELKFKYSYFIMLGAMLLIAIGMLMYFRKRKWL